ncbi:MAG: hypothetical protein V3T59_10575 [Desulfobacterales bacterium]
MFVKITFRFKECMQRLSFRANQIVPTMSSEVQTLFNRNIFMTTGIR